MEDHDRTEEDALAILGLLARGEPASAFEELSRKAVLSGSSGRRLEALEHARNLAGAVHAAAGRRQQREAGLAVLVDTAKDLTLSYDLDDLLKVIVRRARLLLSLDMSYINFHESESGDSYVRTADGHATALTVGFRVPTAAGLGGDAWENKAPFATHDYLADTRIRHNPVIDQVIREEGLRAVMAIPLCYGETFFGVLYVADRNVRHFAPEEIALMSSLADLATVAIEKASQLHRARRHITRLEQDRAETLADLTTQQRLNDVPSRMLDVVIGGGELTDLVEHASEVLGGPLMLWSPNSRTPAADGDFAGLDDLAMVKTSLDSQTKGEALPLDRTTWVMAVSEGREHFGAMVLRTDGEPTGTTRRLLRLAAQAASVLLMLRRNTAVAESQVREEFFGDLLSDIQRPPQQLREKARRLSMNLESPHVVVVARHSGDSRNRIGMWASSYAYRMNGLKSVQGDSVVLLLSGTDAGRIARATLAELSPILGQPVTVGSAGPIYGPEEISRAHREAIRCVRALTALGHTGSSASASDLGFLGMLLADDQDAEGFIRRTIGSVIDYDRQRSTDLLGTLESYFESGSSPTYAAEALHVHPNTVSRRLERITELVGPDWQKPDRALDIQLALRLQRVSRTLLPGEDT